MLNAISGKGVCALAGLRRLRCVEPLGARCSACGIWSLATSREQASRVVRIRELGSAFGDIGTELFESAASGTEPALPDCSNFLLVSRRHTRRSRRSTRTCASWLW